MKKLNIVQCHTLISWLIDVNPGGPSAVRVGDPRAGSTLPVCGRSISHRSWLGSPGQTASDWTVLSAEMQSSESVPGFSRWLKVLRRATCGKLETVTFAGELGLEKVREGQLKAFYDER